MDQSIRKLHVLIMAQLGGDPSDYWWLRPSQPDNPLPAMQLGARIAAEKRQDALQEMQIANREKLLNISLAEEAYKQQVREEMSTGGAEFAKTIAETFKSGDITSPESMEKIYGVGAKYPHLLGSQEWNGFMGMVEKQKALKLRKEMIDKMGYVPRDEETGAPGYFIGANGAIKPEAQTAPPPTWVPADAETGMPGHFDIAGGKVAFPKITLGDGTTFQPEEKVTPGGTRLVHVSPNKWQVLDKSTMSGRMTDQEKQQILDIRSEERAIAKDLSDFGGVPTAKDRLKQYNAKIEQLDKLKAKRDSIYAKSLERENKPAESTSERVVVSKDGKQFTLPKSQLDEAIKQGYEQVK